jgi:carbon monoxide dehydrogenase subunit G
MAEIQQEFDVMAPVDDVWSSFEDVPRLVPCMPGAEILDSDGDTYRGRLRIKVGAIAAEFEGTATTVERDEGARRCRIEASGVDRRGGNRGSAVLVYEMTPIGGGTRVKIVVDYRLQGPMAQFSRGLIPEISARLTREFAGCLRDRVGRQTKVDDVNPMGGA